MTTDLTKPCQNKESKNLSTPILYFFNSTVAKIKELQGIDSLYLALPESLDILQVYIFTKKEDLELETKITELYTAWETTYNSYPEFHILPITDLEGSKEEYMPETAIKL